MFRAVFWGVFGACLRFGGGLRSRFAFVSLPVLPLSRDFARFSNLFVQFPFPFRPRFAPVSPRFAPASLSFRSRFAPCLSTSLFVTSVHQIVCVSRPFSCSRGRSCVLECCGMFLACFGVLWGVFPVRWCFGNVLGGVLGMFLQLVCALGGGLRSRFAFVSLPVLPLSRDFSRFSNLFVQFPLPFRPRFAPVSLRFAPASLSRPQNNRKKRPKRPPRHVQNASKTIATQRRDPRIMI